MLCIVFAIMVYGVSLPASHILPVIVTIALAALVFCALGVAVSSLIPNLDSGPAIINLPYFIMVFISGTYFPINGGLAKVAAWLPLRPFIVAMYNAFNPLTTGSALGATPARQPGDLGRRRDARSRYATSAGRRVEAEPTRQCAYVRPSCDRNSEATLAGVPWSISTALLICTKVA